MLLFFWYGKQIVNKIFVSIKLFLAVMCIEILWHVCKLIEAKIQHALWCSAEDRQRRLLLNNLIITYNLYKEVSDKIGKNIKQERLENYFIKSNYCVVFFFLILCTVQSWVENKSKNITIKEVRWNSKCLYDCCWFHFLQAETYKMFCFIAHKIANYTKWPKIQSM